MIPDPLHPAVVHFPIVLAVLLPIFALGALWAIGRGASARRSWALPLALAGALVLSAWVAVQTGEAQEDAVEDIVGEEALHEHEEAGERLLVLSGALLLVGLVGMVGGTAGRAARYVTAAGTVVVLIAGFQVGAAGGELVYEHGAASAYVGKADPGAGGAAGADRRDEEDERGEER